MICPYSVYIKNIYTPDIIYHILKFVHPSLNGGFVLKASTMLNDTVE